MPGSAFPAADAVGTRIAPFLPGRDLSASRRALLRWYDRNRRDLPWRKTCDPYRIWVSEIMLQQTRVAAVLEHYRLFLKRFPNIRALAKASESAVLASWSGLGYYRRARRMRQCAQIIMQDHDGKFPTTVEQLQSLPGIGRYTAAAIASIAFEEPAAVVDGNVERVLERINGCALTPKETWTQAQALLLESRPGDHNQAMMELGATVCTPRQPRCGACPVRTWCVTKGEVRPTRSMDRRAPTPGPADEVPMPSPPATVQTRKEIWCALYQSDDHIRLVQRPATASLMPAMWELPQSPDPKMERRAPAPGQAPKGRKNSAPWRTFRHSITTTDYTVHVRRAARPAAKGKWIPISQIPHMPITGLTRKILKAAGII